MTQNQIGKFLFQDVLDNKEKQKFIDIRKEYQALDFWETAAEYYTKSFQKKEQYQMNVGWFLQAFNVLEVKSILEVGCGFGRLLPFILDGMADKAPESIYGVDFCQKMIEFSNEYLKEYPNKDRIKILMLDARSLPYKDGEFECLFTDSLFTHLKFGDAQKIANEMKRVTSKYIVTVERYVFDGEHPEPHIFSWDINKFFKMKVLERRLIGQGLVGTVLEKRQKE